MALRNFFEETIVNNNNVSKSSTGKKENGTADPSALSSSSLSAT